MDVLLELSAGCHNARAQSCSNLIERWGVGIEAIDKASFVYTSQLMYHHSVASPGTGHFCFNPKADIPPPVNSPSYIPPTNLTQRRQRQYDNCVTAKVSCGESLVLWSGVWQLINKSDVELWDIVSAKCWAGAVRYRGNVVACDIMQRDDRAASFAGP